MTQNYSTLNHSELIWTVQLVLATITNGSYEEEMALFSHISGMMKLLKLAVV